MMRVTWDERRQDKEGECCEKVADTIILMNAEIRSKSITAKPSQKDGVRRRR